jgi:hypothetical protein
MKTHITVDIPDGWEFDRFDFPKRGDTILGVEDMAEKLVGDVVHGCGSWSRRHVILRKEVPHAIKACRAVLAAGEHEELFGDLFNAYKHARLAVAEYEKEQQ